MDAIEYAETIDADRHVETLLSLLSIDTQNPPGTTRESIDAIDERFRSLGIETERITVDPEKPNLLARIPGASDRTLLYQGHVDTVPFSAGEWAFNPLGDRDGDRIYGRGATDMKGAVASMLMAAESFVRADEVPPLSIAFLFVSDEEVAGDAGMPAVLEAGAIDAKACVVGETTSADGQYSTTVADRGSIWLTLTAAGEAAHGSRPMLGVNAINTLCSALEALNRRLPARRFEFDPAVRDIIDESIDYYADTLGEATARELFEGPTVNVGTIEGGEMVNSVPEQATARVDIRLSAGVHTPRILGDIRECLNEFDQIEIADVSWSIGTYEPIDGPIVSAVSTAAEAVTGESIVRRSATGGGDVKTLRNAGIETVEFGVGTDTAHAVDEYTTVDALVENTGVFVRLPRALATAWSVSAANDRGAQHPNRN